MNPGNGIETTGERWGAIRQLRLSNL